MDNREGQKLRYIDTENQTQTAKRANASDTLVLFKSKSKHTLIKKKKSKQYFIGMCRKLASYFN